MKHRDLIDDGFCNVPCALIHDLVFGQPVYILDGVIQKCKVVEIESFTRKRYGRSDEIKMTEVYTKVWIRRDGDPSINKEVLTGMFALTQQGIFDQIKVD